jgi:hypothetical protein
MDPAVTTLKTFRNLKKLDGQYNQEVLKKWVYHQYLDSSMLPTAFQ